ncbi:hypothetical protein K438DRAFT_2032132 [Mycena galopus ATCC 62051]|nr:hypothetical protein K438DRAFT_2032132 [Mycena galopus ATCC 62051]
MDHSILKAFSKFQGGDWRKLICATCCSHVDELTAVGREMIWEELPGIFGLPAWNELKNDLWTLAFRYAFKDLPQPPEEPTVDSRPVLELQDTVEDVQFLLKALFFVGQTALPFAVMAAFIRLGHKYNFKTLFDSAVARLTLGVVRDAQQYLVL